MALKVVHLTDQEKLHRETEAKALWEEVLKPKWEAQARLNGEKLLAAITNGSIQFKTDKHA